MKLGISRVSLRSLPNEKMTAHTATIAGALIIGGASLFRSAPSAGLLMLGAGFGLGLGVVSLAN